MRLIRMPFFLKKQPPTNDTLRTNKPIVDYPIVIRSIKSIEDLPQEIRNTIAKIVFSTYKIKDTTSGMVIENERFKPFVIKKEENNRAAVILEHGDLIILIEDYDKVYKESVDIRECIPLLTVPVLLA